MRLEGSRVRHRVFGEGTITYREAAVLRVLFEEEAQERAFVYPDAFERFLAAEDPAVAERAFNDLNALREQQRQEREERRHREEELLAAKALVKQRRKPAAKKPASKAKAS